MSTCTVVTSTPLRRTWSARSLIRAAPLYQVSWLAGAADKVGSPPPFSTTTPGCPVVITRVVSRASRSRASSAAPAVSTLFVDAGCIGTSAPWAHNCAPVSASVILPVSAPRFGSATSGASVAASRSGDGLSVTGRIAGGDHGGPPDDDGDEQQHCNADRHMRGSAPPRRPHNSPAL